MTPTSPREDLVQHAIAAEEMRGLHLAMRWRLFGLAVVSVWVVFENRFPIGLWYLGLVGVLALSGSVPLFVQRSRLGLGWLYGQAVIDAGVLAVAVFVANPFDSAALPPQMQLRFSNELYLFGLVGLSALSYAPRLVLWTGFAGAAVWSLCVLWVVLLPESVADFDYEGYAALSLGERLDLINEPYRIMIGVWLRQMLLLLLLAITLAIAVARSRRLVVQQVSVERERANLARYFSPKLVEELAHQGAALGETRERDVIVLFADLAGFTTFAAEQSPDEVIALLRGYHRRISRQVFAHDGTLEEYLGDGVMATFGNPGPSATDAANALRCARGIVRSIEDWSQERRAAGANPLQVRVGMHRGPVVIGNVGEEQLQFAVVGDAVNVASRLQELAKELGVAVAMSDEVVEAAREEGVATEEDLAGLCDAGGHELRGRRGVVRVWSL